MVLIVFGPPCINLSIVYVCTCMFQVKGLPANQGQFYRQDLENLFMCCDEHHRKPKVHFEETRQVLCTYWSCFLLATGLDWAMTGL